MVLLFYEPLTSLKKFATLQPKNWLAETPQTLAARRLGRQSAERERISENSWNVILRTAGCGDSSKEESLFSLKVKLLTAKNLKAESILFTFKEGFSYCDIEVRV